MSGVETARKISVTAILLAAGSSRRFGAANKLVADVAGRPVVARVAEALAASGVAEIVVVTGHEAARVEAALGGLRVRLVHNPDHATGIGSSIAAGARALRGSPDGVLVVQGDMPGLPAGLVDRLIDLFRASDGAAIVHPVLPDGGQTSPVLWPGRYLGDLAALSGDRGAKALIGREAAHVRTLALSPAEAELLIDVDTPEALAAARRRLEPEA